MFDPVVLLHLRRTRHLDADGRLFPVGAGLGVQQVQLWGRRLGAAADHVLGADLRRHLLLIRQRSIVEGGLRDGAVSGHSRTGARPRAASGATASAPRHPAGVDGVIAFPIFWMVSTSFKDSGECGLAAALAADAPTLHNYAQIFAFSASTRRPLGRRPSRRSRSGRLGDAFSSAPPRRCWRSCSARLAYSISRFNVGGNFRHTILTIRMIPPIVVAISILLLRDPDPVRTSAVLGVRISLFDTWD